MKVRISPVTGLPFIFRAVILIGPGTRTRFMRRYVRAQSHADLRFIMPLTHKQCRLTMSSGYGFYKLTMWVCGTWHTGAQVDSTLRFMVFRLWKVMTDSQMPSVRLSWSRLLLCTQNMVMLSSSFHEYCWDYSQHHICLSYTQYTMAWCSTPRVWCCSHDTFQNTSVLAQRILLWILSNWSQRYLNVDHLLDPTQWVSLLLSSGLGIYYHRPFMSRLWIIVPSMIVWVLGKSIIQSLVVASDSPKVHSKKMI